MESGTGAKHKGERERERETFQLRGRGFSGEKQRREVKGGVDFGLTLFSRTNTHTHTQTCILFYLGTHELAHTHTRTLHVSFFLHSHRVDAKKRKMRLQKKMFF